MTVDAALQAASIARRLRESGLTIYDSVPASSGLYYDVPLLQARLREELLGRVFAGPIRTRSLAVKRATAEALGYPSPKSFRRVRPRFPGQNLDIAVQYSDNYQVWNEEVDALRRYAFVRPSIAGDVVAVRVVTGDVIAALDRTGTLTSKYQASRRPATALSSVLLSDLDTVNMLALVGDPSKSSHDSGNTTADPPAKGKVLPISEVFARLSALVGVEIADPGQERDRIRGEALQKAVAIALNVGRYENVGQWPDFRSQALEVKLQTARTIDLGLVLPSSTENAEMLGAQLRHCDVRYGVFFGSSTGIGTVRLEAIVLSTGLDFFKEFRLFGGLEINRKLQIKLPKGFFEPE